MAKGITVPVVQSGLEASIEAAAKKAGPLSLSATVDPSSFKRLAQPLGRVSGLATEFEKSIAASNARVIAFGASVGIINGVQNAFASLVKTTIEVEKSLTNIAVISGKTTDELQPFSRALFEIAKTTSQSFQTASEAALEFSRQGLSLEETLKRTQDALTLTRFTTLSAAEAVDVLTAAANSFGETGITTSEILNKLVAVDTKFAVSAEDLAKGLSRAGSIAQEVGVNFDELNAIVTIAQERTARGGAVIGNAFKTIFTRIRSDETIQALQSVGIYSFDAEGKLKPVVSLLEELAGTINTLGETKRIEVLEAIASKYNINVLTALVDDLGSTSSKFREARDISAGAQNEAYQRQIELNQTLDAVITRVTNSAAQLADTLGRIGVTDSLKSLLNFFDNILTGINDVIDSEGIGGTIAKGLISGLSGVFFKIGIPLLLAIFVKLTKDIAQFGVESLKTILGINREVRERQALEQAVVNTLIKDQQVMASILSLSGDRRKQEEYLLSVYNRQLAALQQVQTIAAGVAPALQAAGLSATSGSIKRRAAEGYLPNAEAKDVRRGVGGASPSSKVVEIPNFSFGGGKRGTMVANTSEYIVPNYAGGSGTAIFNQDMAKEYGLPPGAKKITASGGFVPASGFVPNFEKSGLTGIGGFQGKEFPYNIEKNLTPGEAKKVRGSFEKLVMESAAKNPYEDKVNVASVLAGRIFESSAQGLQYIDLQENDPKPDITEGPYRIAEAKLSYQAGLDDPRLEKGGEKGNKLLVPRTAKQDQNINKKLLERGVIAKKHRSIGHNFLFGKAKEIIERYKDTPREEIAKGIGGFEANQVPIYASASKFTSSKASTGYIPNFAELNDKGIYAGLVGETAPDKQSDVQRVTKYVTPTEKGVDVYDTGIKSADSVTFDLYRVPKKNEFKLKSIREALGNTGKNLAIDLAREVTGGALGNNVAEQKLTQTFNPGSLQSFANTIFEASVGALLSDKSFQDYTEQSTTSLFDLNIAGNSLIKKNFGIKDSVNALEVKGASTPKLLNSIAEKIYKVTAGGQEAFTKRTRVYLEDPNRSNKKKVATAFIKDGVPFVETAVGVFEPKKEGFDASQYELLKKPKIGAIYKTGALGYVPNYVSERAKAAIDRLKKQGATSGEMQAAEAAEARIRGRESAIPRSLLTLDDEKFLETQGGSIEKAMGFGLNPILEKLQSIRNNEELQNSDSTQIKSLKEKIGTVNLQRVWKMIGNQESRRLQVQKTLIEKRYPTRIQGAALGYIPNFAQNDPLKEAIGREVAAGVSPARVRVTQDGRLKNRDNPDGLAVINTRDEPNGRIPNDFRERGMRAAMASRGFVPNFAEENVGVNVKGIFTGKTKEFNTKIDELAKATNEALLEYKQNKISLEQLNEKINASKTKLTELVKAQSLSADVERKYAKTVDQGIKKIDERNKTGSPQSIGNQKSTVQSATGIIETSKIGDKIRQTVEKIDLKKFLAAQAAIEGVTYALRSATEEGSALGNTLEITSAGLTAANTAFALIGTGLGPVGIGLAAVATAATQLAPLFGRLYEAQKTPAERAAEALSKLAKEAEKTGRKISPEEFLAVFEEQDKITKAKQQEKTGRGQIDEFLSQQGINASSETVSQLYGIANTLDFISKDGKVNQEKLKELITTSSKNIAVRGGSAGTGYVATQTSVDIGTTIKAAREKVLEKRLADVRKPQTEDRTDKTINAENQLLKIKFGILDNIVKKELEINKAYADRIRNINSENTALERAKGIITERQFAELQASQEREKVRAEEAKAISENANNLRSSLAGLKDEGLGNIFGEADVNKLQGLLEAFKTGGGVGSEAFGKAFEAATARVGQDGKPIAGTNIAQLSSQTQQDIYKNLSDAANNEARARGSAENRIADVNRTLKDFKSSTQLLIDQTNEINATIAGTTVTINELRKSFSGAAKYEELLLGERAKLANSLSKAVLQNKISLDLAEENFASEVGLLALRINLEEELRKRVPIEARAGKDAMELNRATAERIDQLKKDALNAGPRLKSQRDILDAESAVIEAEENLFKNGIDLANVSSLRRSTLAKLEQSERKAEEENLASIQIIGKKVEANRASLVRETDLIKAENNYYDTFQRLADISALRESTLAKLDKSEREAEIQNQVAIEIASKKYDTDLDAIRRQAELTEAQNLAAKNTSQLNAVLVGLRLARAKLVESERKAEEENQIAIRIIGESYQADINSTKRKIEYAQALIGQIGAAKMNEKVTGEMTLETMNLITSLREAQAKFNNIDIEVGNEALRARTNVLGETTSTISRGLALSNLRIGGELETQAFAQVAEQRRGGREAEDISTSELYDISKGRNLSVRQGLSIQKAALLDEAQTFQDIIGKSTPKLFADGMAEAMQAALNQADDLGGALRNVALTFLKNLQSAFLQSASRQIVASILPNAVPTGKEGGYVVKGYASGGLVTGGSGYKDDVPAMLSEGEYVIRKSSVNKYGTSNLQKLNSGEAPKFADGGIFLPGVRGQGQISGYKDLTAFANQRTTSGATDVLAGGATTAFASLEDQSSKLSAYALMNEDDTINQEIRSAQEQARNIMAEREAYRTAERKAFQKQLVGTVASAALSFGVGKLGSMFAPKAAAAGIPNLGFDPAKVSSNIGQVALPTPNTLSAPIRTTSTSFGDFMSPARMQTPNYGSVLSMFQPQMQSPALQGLSPFAMPPRRAYGGAVKRYSAGGPTDDIPALLMGGEYVMNRQATKKYGRQFFDSINQGRAPRFADGGNVSTAEPSFAEKAASSSDSKATGATSVSININVTGGTSDTQTQGDTKQGGVDYKKMSEQIKQVVIQTINEEKRLGGSLRPRG